MDQLSVTISAEDLKPLRWATRHLEHPGLAAHLTSVVGAPVGNGDYAAIVRGSRSRSTARGAVTTACRRMSLAKQ